MTEWQSPAEGQRQRLLERLRAFEEAAEQIHPEKGAQALESVAPFRDAARQLRLHLSHHLASKEMVDWPELPDSDAAISAFAAELKTEHRELLDELAQLIEAADALQEVPDRANAASEIRRRSHSLALRIARHAGEEEAPMGNYL